MWLEVHRHVSIPVGFSRSLQQEVCKKQGWQWIEVSIPVGFSRSLQQIYSAQAFCPLRPVSIPVGFSRSLQLQYLPDLLERRKLFQSLSGFLVRCNFTLLLNKTTGDKFQSLSGFLVRCNIHKGAGQVQSDPVSIPVGFSRSLQRNLHRRRYDHGE